MNRGSMAGRFPARALAALLCAVMIAATAGAQEAERVTREISASHESELFARQGGAEVTQADFDAYLSRVPEEDRQGLLISAERVGRILRNMVLVRLLGNEARQDEDFFGDSARQARLYQVIAVFLAEEYREHYLSEHMLDDYGQQARELYMTEPGQFRSPRTVDFTHVLVESGRERGETAAMERILAVYERLQEGADLEALVADYSDDPEAGDNDGSYEQIDPDSLDDIVAETLTILQPGQISEPVRSQFGWHILRLDGENEPRQLEWEQAEPEARRLARANHRAELVDSLYRRLLDSPLEVAPGALDRLLQRYGVGEDDYPSLQEIRERISQAR